MEGPPLGPGGEDITWPDQVAPRGRRVSSTRKIKPQTSNLKHSVLVHLDVHSIPSNTETRVSKLKWMNEQCKKAGLNFFHHDNTYAVLSDAPLSYRANPSYTPTDAKSVVICAPRSISFRDINKANSLFGIFTSIQPLKSNPSAKSHQYFEALFQNLGCSILAHQEKVQGITFTSGSPNLLKK